MHDTRLKGIRIVAVDDDPDSRDLLKAILEGSGAQTVAVSSGREALHAIKYIRPDVLISDLAMPEMDGYELIGKIRQLRKKFGSLHSIAVTGSVRHEERARSLQAGFEFHFTKPFDPNRLVTAIEQLVESKRRRTERQRFST